MPRKKKIKNNEENKERLNKISEDLNRFNIYSNSELFDNIITKLDKLKKENQNLTISATIDAIQTLITEYEEISRRILDEVEVIKNGKLYDELSIVRLNENIDKLLMHRSEIKDKIIKYILQLEKIILEREKHEFNKERAKKDEDEIVDIIEADEF